MVQTQDISQQIQGTDFTKREEILALLPIYKQLQLASRKPLPKGVNVPDFTMKTPYGDQILLDFTELIIEPNRRQCLVGPNSCGKTLLFHNMVTGAIKGFPNHLHVHHCRELESHELGQTVLDTVVNSHPYRGVLLKCQERLKTLLSTEPLPTGKDAEALKSNLEFITSQINAVGNHELAVDKAQKMLRVLGFDDIGQNKLVSSLSGGLKMRVALCMAFFIEADLLLLDEPTNHLDFPSVLWLENRLRGYKGSFLLVSHDRELLKNVCTAVSLFEEKQIKNYNCGFLEFEKKKAAEDKKKYEDIEKFLKKNENANPQTPIGRLRLDRKIWSDNYHAKLVALQSKFTFPAAVPLAKPEGLPETAPENISLINLKNVRFSYDVNTGHYIFNDPISFNVTASTRVGVMGPNGAGKSTLLKLLTKKLIPTSGTVEIHPRFKLAYFGQHSTAELDLDTTPITYMESFFPKVNSGQLRCHLSKTGIVGNVADTRIRALSYSQRSCVIFSKLTYACPHLLIMDEPTNFLDLESVDSLISACNKYKGALLLVSHNRDFLKKCARQYLSVVPGHFDLYDDLKTAEKATYTFIEEMEGGGRVSGKEALVNNPGGGTVHASQKVEASVPKSAPAKTIIEISSTTPAPVPTSDSASVKTEPTPVKSEAAAIKEDGPTSTPQKPESENAAQNVDLKTVQSAEPFSVGEKIQAKYSQDGRWYNAVINNIKDEKFLVYYIDYGNTEYVALSSVRKHTAPAPAPKKGGPNNYNNNRQQGQNRGPKNSNRY
jgi:ATPase subunit of ABC transporter with duplicated ATPase domains